MQKAFVLRHLVNAPPGALTAPAGGHATPRAKGWCGAALLTLGLDPHRMTGKRRIIRGACLGERRLGEQLQRREFLARGSVRLWCGTGESGMGRTVVRG